MKTGSRTLDSLIKTIARGKVLIAGSMLAGMAMISCGDSKTTTYYTSSQAPFLNGFSAVQQGSDKTVLLTTDATCDRPLTYTFQQKNMTDGTYAIIGAPISKNTMIADSNQYNQEACFRSTINDNIYPEIASQDACLTLKDMTPPSNIRGLATPCTKADMPGSNSTNTECITMATGTDNDSIASIDVYSGYTKLGSMQPAETFYATGLTPDTTYTFAITAKDPSNNQTSVAFQGKTDLIPR